MESEDRSVFDLRYITPANTFSYGEHEDQIIDFYLSLESTKPTIVLIHGGYWRPEYDRKHLAPLAQKFTELGWPVALIEYRRIIGNADAAMSDVVSAIEELINQNRKLILIGHSAGGHLALLAANKLDVLGVIALAPVTDLVKAEELDLDEGAVSDFLGGPASLRVDLDPARQPTSTVPTTLIHGVLDIRVPIAFSRDYVARAASSNIKLIELESIGHFELIDPRHKVFDLILKQLAQIG
jgi:acetyl esterase/lipase